MPLNLISTVCAALGAVLAVALLQQRENRAANRVLASVLLVVLVRRVATVTVGASPAVLLAPLVSFPLLGVYFETLIGQREGRLWPHGLPFLAGLAWLCFAPAREAELAALDVLVGGGYLVAIIRCLKLYEQEVGSVVASKGELGLGWLRLLVALVCGLWLVGLAELFFDPVRLRGDFSVLALTVSLGILVNYSLRHSRVFSEVGRELTEVRKPAKLSPEELTAYVSRLAKLFESERPYLNPDLRLMDLAKRLGIRPDQLSTTFTTGLNTTFFHYVNSYRIEEAKRRLVDKKYGHLNILGIALDSGFNSKSSFAAAFKKWTGETPSSYRARSPVE